MANEYASSPVEQAGIQTRMGSFGGRFFTKQGNTISFSATNVSGSLKKLVTPISMSLYNASNSFGCVRRILYVIGYFFYVVNYHSA